MTAELTTDLRHIFDQWFASIAARDATFVDRFMEFRTRPLGGAHVALVTGAYHGRIEFAGQVPSDKSVGRHCSTR